MTKESTEGVNIIFNLDIVVLILSFLYLLHIFRVHLLQCFSFLYCLLIYFSLNSRFIFTFTVLRNALLSLIKSKNKMFVLYLWTFPLIKYIQQKMFRLSVDKLLSRKSECFYVLKRTHIGQHPSKPPPPWKKLSPVHRAIPPKNECWSTPPLLGQSLLKFEKNPNPPWKKFFSLEHVFSLCWFIFV